MDYAISAYLSGKMKRKRTERQLLKPSERTKHFIEHKTDDWYQILIGALGTVPKGLVRGQEELDIRGRAETI